MQVSFPKLTRNAKTQAFLIDRIASNDGDECALWPYSKDTGGYGRFNFLGTHHNAHRIVCRAVHGEPRDGQEVAHICGNRACCNSKHLEWTTRKENHSHKRKHGTLMQGEKVPWAKLNKESVQEIRIALHAKEKIAHIAARYSVSTWVIHDIRRGKTWRSYA